MRQVDFKNITGTSDLTVKIFANKNKYPFDVVQYPCNMNCEQETCTTIVLFNAIPSSNTDFIT